MYREMRRKDRAISKEKALQILEENEYGILSTIGEDGQPYGTPLSYVMINGSLYFHCALSGQKIANIAFEERVCFCVVGNTQPVYDGGFSTYFESVVVYGKASAVSDEKEKINILITLAKKYLPGHMDKAPEDIRHSLSKTAVYKITMEHITGKAKEKAKNQTL